MHPQHTPEELQAFKEALTVDYVRKYYSHAEADALTFPLLWDTTRGYKRVSNTFEPHPSAKFEADHWLVLTALTSRLLPQQIMMERKAGLMILPVWFLVWAGFLALCAWLFSPFEKYLTGLPILYQYLIESPALLVALASFFLFIPLSNRLADYLEAQFDRLPLKERLETIKQWENRNATPTAPEADAPVAPSVQSESVRYVSRAGTVSGGFRQRIGERGADLFLRLLPVLFVCAILLFVLFVVILRYWSH